VTTGAVRFDANRKDAARLVDEFLDALRAGDVDGVVRVLADEVVFTAAPHARPFGRDGGGSLA
jgi:RNA polymerase sigma-70 factor (ECF subfamily)